MEKSAAVLTIHCASDMTSEGRTEIANWLRKQAKWLEDAGDNYSSRFVARYLYDEKEERKEDA